MLTRPNAHYYEKALLAALKKKEPKEAIKIIGLIEIYEGALQPSLNVTDENGMNFLRVMLDSEFRDAAKRLLESKSFTPDPAYLFGVNNEGQTLLCQTARLGYKDIVKLLYHRFIDDAELNLEGNKNWFKADNKGNTPLHYAVQSKYTDLYIFIIEKIRERKNAVDMIDAANQEGDTALHFAVGDSDSLNTHLIDALLTAGACLHHVNSFRQSPFQKILQKDSDEQIKLLCSLNKDNKKSLLDSYSDYLKKNPADKKIWKVYASFKASKESLKDLTIAHLEHNPYVPPKMDVKKRIRTSDKKENDDSFYPTETISLSLNSLEDKTLGKHLSSYYSKLYKGFYAQQGIFGVPHSFYQNMARRKELFKQDKYVFEN